MNANECYLPPRAGNLLDLGGLGVHFKIRRDQTGGAFAIVEHPIEPHVIVEPHVHRDKDELSYVVAGTISARVGNREVKALPGSYVVEATRSHA
jgi:quercetin dioxygenase-like cupin family protein